MKPGSLRIFCFWSSNRLTVASSFLRLTTFYPRRKASVAVTRPKILAPAGCSRHANPKALKPARRKTPQ